MKQQVVRFSLHQNAKVFAVLIAISSLIFLIPLMLIFMLATPVAGRPPMIMIAIMPIIYLVFGYISVAIGCAIYNFMYPYIGGIEFESKADGV